ncbi:probable serine/threonine-protein kinase drkD isoform X2 [Nasonia vitripennis]|uniref:C2H2-type domain-containing protein n=1 Tax=Nasonia vitripennis TaxID=7425 RepID=A0A7M7ISP7_NASVI|nr:probable serine/threonine-protein kinase drkD isoform X2 [Nasonia vitripennis]
MGELLFCRLEMSSSLERDYDEFEFSRENQLEAANVEGKLQKLGNKSNPEEENQHRCDICDQKFPNKKDLQDHFTKHLGNPRVVLQRIVDQKLSCSTAVKKEHIDNYWLGEEQKGNLKITLKRQSPVGDSLKLTLKKSPKSEGFTVVSRNCGSIEQSIKKQNALAETQENDNKSDSEEEKATEQNFENVMLNQENTYDDDNDNFESGPDHNPLESSERPLMDNVEGDSGVGSDSVHLPEREEQNEDDGNADNNSNLDQAELAGNEDPEESDALEATCRETIENLKKLGEHSRFIGSRSSDLLNLTETPAIEEEEEENDDAESNRASCVIEELRGNSEISIVPKSALMPGPSTSSPSRSETDIVPIGGSSNSSFNWNKITEDSSSSKIKDDEAPEKDTPDNTEAAGSLLQNFLLEHQRNQNESNLSSSAQNFETEYVSLERLAETVNTCRVCNEKFKDMAHLDAHRSKAGHYQCTVPDCSALVFTSLETMAIHKSQVHGAPISPGITVSPRRLASNSPQAANSPTLSQTSPRTNTRSPHSPSFSARRHSPHTNSPTYNMPGASTSHASSHAPVPGLEHLTAPMQQLAQQVQRISVPPAMHISAPGGLLQGPGGGYYQGPGRPPMYRNSMNFPSSMMQMYQQYAANQYQMQCQVPLQPPTPQQATRGRYPGVVPGQRPTRMPTIPPANLNNMHRTRAKRPMLPPSSQIPQQIQPQVQQQLQQATTGGSAPKQRRMDVLLPDRNEDADCHVIAQQKRNDGLPVIQNVQGGATLQPSTSNDSTIHLTDQITLSVRQPAQVNAMVQGAKKPDASSVANVLASRGITVTPATNNKKSQDQPQPGPSGMQQQQQKSPQQQSQQQQSQQQQAQQQQRPLNVPALNLSSAISIIPTASAQRRQQEQPVQFAVPQSRQATSEVERPPRPPTVDLTQDPPPQAHTPARRGRPPNLPNPNQYPAANRMHASLTCQVCDKRFQSQELLAQHMATHRQSNKLIYKCGLGGCTAAYPSLLALNAHRTSFHRETIHPNPPSQQNGNVELALPVVDLQSTNTLTRLHNLGIDSFIPLSQLSAQTSGCYGLPIISIDGARNPAVANLAALGATSILSLGPLRHINSNNNR